MAGSLLWASSAFAQEPPKQEPPKPEPPPAAGPTENAREIAPARAAEAATDAEQQPPEGKSDKKNGPTETGEGEHEEHEPEVGAGFTVDFVVGGANLETVAQGPLKSGTRDFTTIVDSSRVTAASLMVGATYELNKHWSLGARIPLIMGDIESRTGAVTSQRNIFMAGNLELEGAYERHLAHGLVVEGSLALALPTGGGEEPPLPDEARADPDKQYNYTATDRFYLSRAAEFTRGSQESVMFESGHFGIVPRVAMKGTAGRGKKFHWSASAKLENLINTSSDPYSRYVLEAVVAVRASYMIVPHVQPGLHAWTNITITAHEERKQNVVLLEPNVRFPFEHLEPYAGVIVPVVGRFVDEKVLGFRGGVSARF